MPEAIPLLYVEGKDDVSVINALLLRHGLDTEHGRKYLRIQSQDSVELLLQNMPDAIRNATDRPVGFVVDIDIPVVDRWTQVRARLSQAGLDAPKACPTEGYIAQLPNYSYPIGVWLMPDCTTDHQMMEHLLATLVPPGDALWSHAKSSVATARTLGSKFKDVHLIKAEIHTWIAWQESPGLALGAAVNAAFFRDDSVQAIAFLRWLKRLFGFTGLVRV